MNFNIGQMMKQFQDMQKDLQKKQEELANIEIEGIAAGGVVRVVINGHMRCLSIEIGKELEGEDLEIVEDSVKAAFNEATRKLNEMQTSQTSKLFGDFPLPGGFKF